MCAVSGRWPGAACTCTLLACTDRPGAACMKWESGALGVGAACTQDQALRACIETARRGAVCVVHALRGQVPRACIGQAPRACLHNAAHACHIVTCTPFLLVHQLACSHWVECMHSLIRSANSSCRARSFAGGLRASPVRDEASIMARVDRPLQQHAPFYSCHYGQSVPFIEHVWVMWCMNTATIGFPPQRCHCSDRPETRPPLPTPCQNRKG